MKRLFRDKALSLVLCFNLIVNSVAPLFTFVRPVVSAEPLKAEIAFKTLENSFDISVNTKEEIEYVLSWKNQDGLQGTTITKAGGENQEFQKDIYAGVKSGPDARRDTVIRGIYKVEVKSQHWITAIKFSLDDGKLIEENKKEYLPDGLDFTEDETKWIEEGDQVTPTPTQDATLTPTPTFVEQGDILDGVSDQNFMTPDVDGEIETSVIESYQCRADSLNGCLVTDKEDYAPASVAIISGYGFAANTQYDLVVSIDDLTQSFDITTDDMGAFSYSYSLYVEYHPFYTVDLKDSSGIIIASTSFTDSPVSGSTIDSAGANDEPGQKDLTKMSVDYSGLPNNVSVTWNWDEIRWTGNNTGDGCALFDTDNDGLVNYALCVIISGNPASYQSKALYSCGDNSSNRCTSPQTTLVPSGNTACSAQGSIDDPFTGGDVYPKDTKAECTIALNDVGGAGTAQLVDVCSYPSQQPNSDPSDCILFRQNSGKIEVIKDLIPSDDPGKFNLQIDGTIYAIDVGNLGTTGEKVVDEGNHTVGEIAGTGTSLSNYSTSISCKDLNGTGSVVASSSNSGPLTVTVSDNDDIVCTITNTRINDASLTIVKDADPNDSQDFAFTTTGAGLSGFSLDDDADGTLSNTKVFTSLAAGTYSVAETPVAGWDLTSATCDDGSPVTAISISSGEDATCTFTNTKLGKIIIEKQTLPDGSTDGFSFTTSWGPSFNLSDGESNDSGYLEPGDYTFSETLPPGWSPTPVIDCSNGNSNGLLNGSYALNAGETITCTVTNTKKGHIIVNKVTNPSGSTQSFDFATTGTGYDDFSLTDTATPNDQEVLPGLYTVSETAVTGWESDGGVCDMGETPDSLDVGPGETVTCTFTNTKIPKLTVVKVVTNDNGGNKAISDFPLFVDGNPVISGVTNSFPVGAYVVSETTDPTYSSTISGACAANGSVTLAAGDNKTCTITNDDIPAQLIVIKHVNNDAGGTATASDFTMTISGVTASGGNSFPGSELPGTSKTLTSIASYSVSESGPTGYAPSYSSDCSGTISLGETKTCTVTNDDQPATLIVKKVVINDNGGTMDLEDFTFSVNGGVAAAFEADGQNNLTVSAGTYNIVEPAVTGYSTTYDNCSDLDIPNGGSATCTITNNDIQPKLTVTKVVINDNGGSKVVSDFPLFVDTAAVTSGVKNGFDVGSYTISETVDSGYAATITGACDSNGNVSLALGDDKSCTITNDDKAATLTLVKTVINNNGGQKTTNDFKVYINDVLSSWGAHSVDAGTYSIKEDGLTGYHASSWGEDCDSDGAVTLANGQNKTCSITNDDLPANIIVIKHVANDGGGTKVASDFTMNITGTAVTASFAGAENPGVNTQANAGTYSVTEDPVSGYSSSQVGDCSGTIANGETKTCTITNSDIAPVLTLIKQVTNDNGGTASASAWTLSASGTYASFSGSGPTVGPNNVDAGVEYTLSETGPSGYDASSWSCDGGTQEGNKITLNLEDDVTCTITNNDRLPKLHLRKTVTKDNGGTANESDWNLTAVGTGSSPTNLSGLTPVDSGADFKADTYTLNENGGPSGYTAGSWNCIGGSQSGNEITLSLGQEATCTINNDDDIPSLTLNKVLINDNGGLANEDDWTLTANGETAGTLTGPGATGDSDVVSGASFKAGTYVLSESTGPDGYSASTWSCVTNGGNAVSGSSVSPGLGDTVVCTITNDDIQPRLIVHKIISGGTASIDDFDYFVVNNTGAVQVQNDETNDFNAGAYQVTEKNNSGLGYTASYSGDCDSEGIVTLNVGDDTKTCNITNTRDTGDIQILKLIDMDGDLSTTDDREPYQGWVVDVDQDGADTDDPTLLVTDSEGKSSATGIKTGEYWVSEESVQGYKVLSGSCMINDGPTGDGGEGKSSFGGVTVAKDTTTYCTFINAPDSTLHGYKWHDEDLSEGPEAGVGESLLSGWTINLYKAIDEDNYTLIDSMATDNSLEHFGWYWFENLVPGDYRICEENQAGWKQTYPINNTNNCHEVSLPLDSSGEMITREVLNAVSGPMYNFGNVKLSRVTVVKYSDDNGNGARDGNEALLSNWTINLNQTGKVTDNEGKVVFDGLLPDSYDLSETLKDGYVQTEISCFDRELQGENNSLRIDVDPGGDINCQIGNQPVNPDLQISKSNDGGEKSPGDTVIYTIKIKVLNSMALGVVLKDLLPEGFLFQNVLSIIKNGTEDMTASVGDPHYASPGTYNLGDMNEGDEITIIYTAKIDGAQEFGLYKDIAWAKATDILDNKILASAQPEGYVDDNFVGTAVRVNGNFTESGNVTITEEGQVLGASTSILPATGANGIWITFAGILMALGLSIIVVWFMIRQKKMNFFAKKMVIILLFGFAMFATGQVYASDLSIRLSEPKTPTKNSDFKLVFTVLDLTESGSPIIAKCFYKKNLPDGWTQFDADKNISAGGNTDSCQVHSGIVNASGQTYYFKATAGNGSASDDSELQGLVSVTFDNSDPGAPTSYKKEKVSSCQYKISFKTANDGMTSRVEIYRSESTTMTLDGSTRVGEVMVPPNTESTFTESIPDCNKTYYYVIRAFNPAGNASGPIGDSVTITTTTSSSTVAGETIGAIPVANVTLAGSGAGSEGQVLGEDKTATGSPTQAPKEINVKGATTSNRVGSFVSKYSNYIIGLLILIIMISVYVFIKRRKTV